MLLGAKDTGQLLALLSSQPLPLSFVHSLFFSHQVFSDSPFCKGFFTSATSKNITHFILAAVGPVVSEYIQTLLFSPTYTSFEDTFLTALCHSTLEQEGLFLLLQQACEAGKVPAVHLARWLSQSKPFSGTTYSIKIFPLLHAATAFFSLATIHSKLFIHNFQHSVLFHKSR